MTHLPTSASSGAVPPRRYLCAIHGDACDHNPRSRHSYYPTPAAPTAPAILAVPAEAQFTKQQLDGIDCIHCGRPAEPGIPVGHIDHVQVFACAACTADTRPPACMHCGNRGPLPRLLSLGDHRYACVPQCPPEHRA